MAGLAKTDNFMLSTATVMLGDMSDLYDLNPTDDSIGLVKNFTLSATPAFTELTQGVTNETVFSVKTGNPVTASMEVYEYTASNLAYSLGLENADNITAQSVSTHTTSAVTGGSPGTEALPVASNTGINAGDYIMILVDDNDNFVIRKVVTSAANSLTVNAALPAIPNGAIVNKVNALSVGSTDDQPFYSAKIAGKLANGDEVVILIPKLRITKGFSIAFVTNNFSNLPFEFTVYAQVASDQFYSDFNGAQALLFRQ